MDNQSQSIWQGMYEQWSQWLIVPRNIPSEPLEAQQAQKIVGYVLLLAIGAGLNLIFRWLFDSMDAFALIAFLLAAGLYVSARVMNYKTIVTLTILSTLVSPFLVLILNSVLPSTTTLIFLYIFALFFASQFLSLRDNLIVGSLVIVTALVLNGFLAENNVVNLLRLSVPVLILAILGLLNARSRLNLLTVLQEQETPDTPRFFDSALQLIPDAALIQVEKQIVAANDAAARLFKIKRELLISLPMNNFMNPESSGNYKLDQDADSLTVRYDDKLKIANDSSITVTITARSVTYGDQLATLMILRPAEEHDFATIVPPLSDNLDEREATFHAMANLMSDYAYALDVQDQDAVNLAWVSGEVYAKTGLSTDEAIDLKDWSLIIHEDDRAFYELRTRALIKGETRSLEYRIVQKNGDIRWIQDTAYPLVDEASGQVKRILAGASDVTERIEAQETLKTHVVQQAVVAELGLLALNTVDREQIMQHVAVLCEQVLSVGFVSIFEYQTKDQHLVCVNLSRPDSPFKVGEIISNDFLISLEAYTLKSQEAIISEDLADEPRFKPVPSLLQANYGSAAGIMIMGNNNTPYGVLSVYSKITHDFTHDEVYFLQAIANVLGTFIERNRAQSAEREQIEFSEALRDATAAINSRLELPEVLEKIMTYLRQVVPQTQQASIMLRHEDSGHYHTYIAWGFDDNNALGKPDYVFKLDELPTLKYMYDTGEAMYIPDSRLDPRWTIREHTPDLISYLGAPIVVEEEVIGFINLDAFTEAAFSDNDKHRLETFAETVSTAIVNAQKQEDLERKVTQRTAELNEQRNQLETILAGSGDGIFYTGNFEIIYANNTFCRMTGYTLEELKGQPTTIFRPDDVSDDVHKIQDMFGTLPSGEIQRDNVRIRRKDGSYFDAGLTVSRVESSDENTVRSVTIVRDVSKERELEDLKKTFIAAAAHDLRSPISSLQMRMHMIKRQPGKMDYHMERLTYIIERMNRLVNDLLDAQGRIVIRPQNMILQTIVDQVVDILSLEANEKGIGFNYESPADPITILADKHRLEQVLFNLITNAINYTDKDGEITVAYRLDAAAKQVMIDIQDTGVGIPQEEQESIFLPFYRTVNNDRKGNGLGLSITREIVKLHQGTLSVSSVVGQGSTFTVSLPLLETD